MKSSRRKRQQTSLSLFPFLAVLICTMGVLIVLLVIVVKHADNSANQVREEIIGSKDDATDPEIQETPPSSPVEDLAPQFEALNFAKQKSDLQIELLADVRDQVRADLEEKRQYHSNVQANINDLRDQARMLSDRVNRIKALGSAPAVDAKLETQQLAELTAKIESAKSQLKESATASKKQSYAIVPFRGTGQTDRRPIFVECTGTAVILQPYGIKLLPSDFQAPMLAGNPLDAALLTIRDFLHSNANGKNNEQPYPLLIVRPDGAFSYGKARRALKSWVDEFGYELVPADMELSYPPTNPQLATRIEQTIKAARIRADAIRQVSNRQVDLSSIERNQYGSQYHGSNQHNSGAGSSATNSPNESGQFATGSQNPTQSPSSQVSGLGSAHAGDFQTQNSPRNTGNFIDSSGVQSSVGSNQYTPDTQGSGESGTGRSSMPLANSEQRTGTSAKFSQSGFEKRGGAGNESSYSGKPNQQIANGNGNGNGNQQTQSNSASQNFSNQQGDSSASEFGTNQAKFGSSGSGGNQQQSASGETQSFRSESSKQAGQGAPGSSSLAEARGEDWALMSKQQNGTAYRRRIYLDCTADRLTIKSAGTNENQNTAIILTRPTASHIDELIDQVWRQVDNWGVAGGRSYWKPQLMIRVKQGGVVRANEIQSLLENSGLDVLLMNQ